MPFCHFGVSKTIQTIPPKNGASLDWSSTLSSPYFVGGIPTISQYSGWNHNEFMGLPQLQWIAQSPEWGEERMSRPRKMAKALPCETKWTWIWCSYCVENYSKSGDGIVQIFTRANSLQKCSAVNSTWNSTRAIIIFWTSFCFQQV